MTCSVTSYEDVNQVLSSLREGMINVLGDNLVGMYLMGSLSYDAFNPHNSDIDLVVVVKEPISQNQLSFMERMHQHVALKNPKWAKRIECSYVPCVFLSSIAPPKTPRPYFGEGIFYQEAPYGNEWIINQYLLYNHGISLYGPEFKTLVNPIHIEDVQEACVKDFLQEWQPKINDLEWLSNSHYQSYIVLNLCRILYTVLQGAVGSKVESAHWVKNKLCPEWRPLIEVAEQWHYGKEMTLQNETIKFIQFVANTLGIKK